MPRSHRLTSSRAFRRVLSAGGRSQAGSVVCFALPTGEDRPARIGVTATKRIGTAVRRSRAKRRLREAARAALPRIPAGTDVVLVATPQVITAPFATVRDDVLRGLERMGAARC